MPIFKVLLFFKKLYFTQVTYKVTKNTCALINVFLKGLIEKLSKKLWEHAANIFGTYGKGYLFT